MPTRGTRAALELTSTIDPAPRGGQKRAAPPAAGGRPKGVTPPQTRPGGRGQGQTQHAHGLTLAHDVHRGVTDVRGVDDRHATAALDLDRLVGADECGRVLVEADADGAAARVGGEPIGQSLGRGAVEIGGEHAGTGGAEPGGHGLADSAGGAGDHGDRISCSK